MSINITVGNGQGITQAIKAHLEKQGVKLTNVKLSDWQKVMTLVNQNQQANATAGKDSIFSGGNDVSRIGKNNGDNNWKTDFQVQAGQVMQFDAGIFNKIVAVLTGKAQETPAPDETPDNQPQTPPPLDAKPQGLSQEPDIPDKIEVPADVQRQSTESMIDQLGGKIIQREVNGEMQDIAVVTVDGQKVRRAINEDGTLGDTLAATKTLGKNEYITGDFPAGTKVLEREVNGQKQQIAVYKDKDGNTQRALVVTDPETGASKLGDSLVAISTFGKNKYITQTEMDNQMRAALGLPQDAQLPDDIKGSYVNIGGEPTLIFKKDGKTLDQAELKEYINNLNANTPQQPQDNGSIDISNVDKKAQELFDTINNNYGDKKGNITFEEYFNYEYQSMDPSVKERFSEADIKMVAQEAFNSLDSINKDGEVTVDEIKAFLKAADTGNDQNVSDAELAEHVGGADDAEQQALVEENVMKLVNEGYDLLPLDDGSYLYQKDGKTYAINLDGTVGNEIKSNTPQGEIKQQAPVQEKLTQEQVQDFMNKDSRLVTIMSNLDNLKTTYENLKNENEEAWNSDDFDKAFNAPSNIDVMDAESRYEAAQNLVTQYQTLLENWNDGKKFTITTGDFAGADFETTTLPNGAKGYVTEQYENGQKVKYYFNIDMDEEFGMVSQMPGEFVGKEVVE